MLLSDVPHRCAVYLIVLGLLGCQNATEEEATPPPKDTVERRLHPDPGPTRQRTTGERAARRYKTVELRVDGVTRTSEAVYLRLPVPEHQAGIVLPDLRAAHCHVNARGHGVAVPAASGVIEDNPWLYVRFPRAQFRAEPFKIDVRLPATLNRVGGLLTINVDVPSELSHRGELDKRFYKAASLWFLRLGGPFASFSSGRLRLMSGLVTAGHAGESAFDTMTPSGVREQSLKLLRDRGEGRRSHVRPKNSEVVPTPRPIIMGGPRVPKSDGTPLEPFKALIERVPYDAFVVLGSHVGDLSDAMSAVESWSKSLAPITRLSTETLRGLATALKASGIERLSSEMPDDELSQFVVYSRNPGLGVAADITVILSGLNRPMVNAALLKWVPEAVNATELAQSRGRFFLRTGTHFVLSNRETETRAAQTTRKRPLSEDSVFWWHLRGSMSGVDRMDPILFAGYGALTRFFGPEVRAQVARMRVARSELMAVDLSARLFQWLNGRKPKSMAENIAAGTLRREDLIHGDGRGKITVTDKARSRWGQSAVLTPELGEISLGVNASFGYERFRDRWRPFLKKTLRPFSIRAGSTARESGLRLLVSGIGEIGGGIEIFDGTAPGAVPDLGPLAGATIRAPLTQESALREWLETMLREATGRRDVGLDWAGDWLTLGIINRGSLWDSVLDLAGVPSREVRQSRDHLALRKRAINTLPAFAVIPIGKVSTFERFRRALKAGIADGLEGAYTWSELSTYNGAQMIELGETLSSEGSRIRLTLAFDQNRLVVAATPQIAELVWNALESSPKIQPAVFSAQLRVALDEAPWLAKSLAGLHFGALFPMVLSQMNRRELVNPSGQPDENYGYSYAPRFPPLPTPDRPFTQLLESLESLAVEALTMPEERALSIEISWTKREEDAEQPPSGRP